MKKRVEIGLIPVRGTAEEREYFLRLRNGPAAVQSSPGGSKISREDHARWWRATRELRWIASLQGVGGVWVGVVRVGLRGRVSIVVDPAHCRQGFATMILAALPAAVRQLQPRWSRKRRLYGEILWSNVASQLAFWRAGWRPIRFEQGVSGHTPRLPRGGT